MIENTTADKESAVQQLQHCDIVIASQQSVNAALTEKTSDTIGSIVKSRAEIIVHSQDV